MQFTLSFAGLPSSFSWASCCLRARRGMDVDPDCTVTLLVSDLQPLSNSPLKDILNIVERDQYEGAKQAEQSCPCVIVTIVELEDLC